VKAEMQRTMNGLKYICDPDQPTHENGGFHDAARHTAESALFHIRRLRKRINRPNAEGEGRGASPRTSPPPCSQFFPLFDHMSREHGLTLTDSELYEIMRVVEPMVEPKCKATCTANTEVRCSHERQ